MPNIFYFTQKRNKTTRQIVHLLLHSDLVQTMKLSKTAIKVDKTTMLLGVTRKSAEGIFKKLNWLDLIDMFGSNQFSNIRDKNVCCKNRSGTIQMNVDTEKDILKIQFNSSINNEMKEQSNFMMAESQDKLNHKPEDIKEQPDSRICTASTEPRDMKTFNSLINAPYEPASFHNHEYINIHTRIPTNLIGHTLPVFHNKEYFLALFLVETDRTFMVIKIRAIKRDGENKIVEDTRMKNKENNEEDHSENIDGSFHNISKPYVSNRPKEGARILVLLKHNTVILTSKEYLLGECCSIKRVF